MIFPPLPVANYAGLLAAASMASQVVEYRPLVFDSGRNTFREGAGVLPLTDEGQWNQVWDQHWQQEQIGARRIQTTNPAPPVDFKKNYVLAIFAGPTRGMVGFRPVSGFVAGKTANLRLIPLLDGSVASAIAIPSPWAFMVLPRAKATLKVELFVNGRWTTVGSVPPTL